MRKSLDVDTWICNIKIVINFKKKREREQNKLGASGIHIRWLYTEVPCPGSGAWGWVPGEHDYIAFDEYYNEPIGRSFGNCDIYNTTITWLRKHDHMARYFPIFLVFGAKFQYFDNGE